MIKRQCDQPSRAKLLQWIAEAEFVRPELKAVFKAFPVQFWRCHSFSGLLMSLDI